MKTTLTAEAREQLIIECLSRMLQGTATQGQMLVRLRKEILAMTQAEYAKLVGVSLRTLSNIENDTSDQTMSVINAAFKPFGFKSGLWSKDQGILKAAINYEQDSH